MSDPAKAADSQSSTAPSPDAAGPTGAPPATKALGADAGKPAVPGAKTAPIKLMAGFEDLPGMSTTGYKESSSHNALWLDTTLTPTKPMGNSAPGHYGVTRGQGAMIGTFGAPLTDTTPAEGTGEIATRLFYSAELSQSFNVAVDGVDVKHAKQAAADARALTAQQIQHEGDVSAIEAAVTAALVEKYPTPSDSPIRVKITPVAPTKTNSVTDAGLRKLYYKVGGPTSIDMEVKSVPAGKAEVQSTNATDETIGGGTQVSGHSEHEHNDVTGNDAKSHVDSHQEQSVDKMDVESTEKVIVTENSFVTSFTQAVKELRDSLIEKAKKDSDEHKRDHSVSDQKGGGYDDYSNNRTTTTEEGDKPKRNWAYYLQSIADTVGEVVKGPAGVGKLEYPEILWGIDVFKQGVGKFVVDGKVHYTEGHDDTDVHDKRGSNDHVDNDRHVDGESHEKSDRDAKLTGAITSAASTLTSSIATKTKSIQTTYHSKDTKTASGGRTAVDTDASHKTTDKTGSSGDTHIDAQRSKTTHIQYNVNKTQTYLRPQLDVTVTEGDGEVASSAFSSKTGNQ